MKAFNGLAVGGCCCFSLGLELDLPDTWALVLAMENGYVTDDAAALLMAASRNVVAGEGLSRFSRESRVYFNSPFRKSVIDGFSVRINVAEYPDQNPLIPFSDRIRAAIFLEDIFPLVCFLVTIFASGVVINFESAPARMPIANSSSTGSTTLEGLNARRSPNRAFMRFWRTNEYARKKRKLSATVLAVSCARPG